MKIKKTLFLIIIVLVIVGAGFYVDSRIKHANINLNTNTIQPSGPPAENTNNINTTQPTSTPVANTNLPSKIDFNNYGKAPDFVGIYKWLNSDPLTIKSLQGRVVLIDFWTYSCINCIRT